ncbi:hypothetical protein Tco_1288167, partial [Tanacetum coccineum]
DWSRPVNVGRTKAEFDVLISDIANLEPEELVDYDTCIWSLFHDDKFLVNSVRKHIDELSLPSLSLSTRWCKTIPRKLNIFMWQMFLDRLPNRLNLNSRGLDIYSIIARFATFLWNQVPTLSSLVRDTVSTVWHLVRVWSGSMFLSFAPCGEWDLWFQSWHASKEKKDHAYAIFVALWESMWRLSPRLSKGGRTRKHQQEEDDYVHVVDCSEELELTSCRNK